MIQREFEYRGQTYTLFIRNDLMTVTSPAGRQKIAEFRGGAPEGLALILAKELWAEWPKKPDEQS